MKKLTEKQILNIIEGRLELQSTRRTLEMYQLPKFNYSFSYFQSSEFARLFNSWDNRKQEKFLQSLAGGYWQVAANLINKNK